MDALRHHPGQHAAAGPAAAPAPLAGNAPRAWRAEPGACTKYGACTESDTWRAAQQYPGSAHTGACTRHYTGTRAHDGARYRTTRARRRATRAASDPAPASAGADYPAAAAAEPHNRTGAKPHDCASTKPHQRAGADARIGGSALSDAHRYFVHRSKAQHAVKPRDRSACRAAEAYHHEELRTEYCQPIKLISAGREIYLLRRDGQAKADVYATRDSCAVPELAVVDGADSVLRVAAMLGLRVKRQRALFVSLDAMEAALGRLRRAVFIPEQAAKAVLDGWHALDDLSRTLGLASPCPTGTMGMGLSGLYDRFFCANTFPARNFGSAAQAPALERDEMDRLEAALRRAWEQVSDRCGQIAPPPWGSRPVAAGPARSSPLPQSPPLLRAA